MTEPFRLDYANCYDALYSDKDYEAECDLIERVLRTYGEGNIGSILDLGCGTGNHALPLARRGFEVIGIDRSEFMLKQARSKAASSDRMCHAEFYQADIRKLVLARRFQAALMMFAVLGYQLSNEDVLAALRSARCHLEPGSLFLFDIWYGPAVFFQRPTERVKVIPTASGNIQRVASSQLDISRHVCTVRYHVSTFTAERLVRETAEEHTMRYFFPLELNLFLEIAGFKLVRLGAFPEFDRDPDEQTWNALCVARAARPA